MYKLYTWCWHYWSVQLSDLIFSIFLIRTSVFIKASCFPQFLFFMLHCNISI